jgi:hypothetical protein
MATDEIKIINPRDENYAIKSHNIFEMNQQRFRIKNSINNLEEESIKEQKSYSENRVYLRVTDIGRAIPIIYYLSVMYDEVILDGADLLKGIFKTKNIIFEKNDNYTFQLDSDIIAPEIFKPDAIDYLAGGKLGDFIHQLSVVYEKFLETGRKGRVFMSNEVGDPFQRGVEETYSDIFPIISKLTYIESLHLYNGENFNFNLSFWRFQSNIYTYSWQEIFFHSYDVKWGNNAWISAPINNELKDVTLISTNHARWNSIDWDGLLNRITGPVMFLEINANDFEYFCKEVKRTIPSVKCINFKQIATAIQNCKLLIATLSMPLALADGMKKQRIAIMPPSNCLDSQIARKTNSNWIDENTLMN